MKIYHLKNFTSGKLPIAVRRQKWSAAQDSQSHRHDFVEVMFLLSGSGINRIDDLSFPVIAGDLFIIPRGAVHGLNSGSGLEFYNLMFSPSLFTPRELELFREHPDYRLLFEPARGTPPQKWALTPAVSDELRHLCEQLVQELQTTRPGALLGAKAYLTLLINAVCRVREAERRTPAVTASDCNTPPLTRLIEYINRHYMEPFDREKAARAAGISLHYLGEFFTRKTGVTPVHYLNLLRIEKAQQLLRTHPALPVSEVAIRCGFADSSYFTRIFRQSTGHTPRQDRERSKATS